MSTDYQTETATEYDPRAYDREAVRHAVDRFEIYREDPISCCDVLTELSDAIMDFDRDDIAQLAQQHAAEYRKLIDGQEATEEKSLAMENTTRALFDYYRWSYDETMPSFRQMNDALEGAKALGEPAQHFLAALENHVSETAQWIIDKAKEIQPMGSEILDILDAQASGHSTNNFGPTETRQMVDRFTEITDWDRTNTLQIMSAQMEDTYPIVADIMDEVAAQYRGIACGVQPHDEQERKILQEATASVLGFYRWQQDGTMPEREQLADTLLGAQSWGPHMEDYLRAVTIHITRQLHEAHS